MVSNADNKWVRIFDITEVCKHRKGFTIYKIISMLYPESCPDAITKIVVWKRFNDIKRLYREIKVLHNKLKIRDQYPNLPKTSFFKRFDEEIIEQRRVGILQFLEYVGDHSQLYTSTEFVKFFKSSHSPPDQSGSNISSIRADLNLPEGPEYSVGNSDDEHTNSDTDSVATQNSLGSTSAIEFTGSRIMSKSKVSLSTSHHSRNSADSISISTTTDSITLLDGQIYPTPPHTPHSVGDGSGGGGEYVQYIIDASIHINMAVELENDQKYDEAFTAYKTAIDILLKYGKDDKNYDRRQMVRYKTEKYLIRAEKIYNMHLASEVKNIKQITQNDNEASAQDHFVQRPISDLYKYKVVRIIASGMLVLHSEYQQLFYIKVIHKTMKFLSDNLILPENVPYMVKLYNYYNCENALFLVLEYCSGKKLWDYIKTRSDNNPSGMTMSATNIFCDDNFDHFLLKQMQEMDLSSDQESEHSYSDLINDYANSSKLMREQQQQMQKQGISEKSEGGMITKTIDDKNSDTSIENKDNDEEDDESIGATFEKINIDDEFRDNGGIMEEKKFSRQFSEISSTCDFGTNDEMTVNLIPKQDIVKWSAQLLLALEKLHALGIICRDLQSHNLLINDDGDLVLTYMCNLNEVYDMMFTASATEKKQFHLAPPEIYSFEPITTAVDWWCYGVILYELLVGMPLSLMHPDGLASYTHLKIPKYVSPEGRSLLKQLLMFEPTERLGYGHNGIDNLKSHPFFHSIRWNSLLEKYNNNVYH